ncbi:MAG TPA: hypothetical protein PK156_47870 [Polyangium sp.]|nr:hypothetical protein [Polyangium sp.]
MKTKHRWQRSALVVALMSVGVFAALGPVGCSSGEACVAWDSSRGACPAPLDAMRLMQPGCGTIESVDGEGEFDASTNSCCYSITKSPDGLACTPVPVVRPDPNPNPMPTGPSVCGLQWCLPCVIDTPCCDLMQQCFSMPGCQACAFDRVCTWGTAAADLANEVHSCIWQNGCQSGCFTGTYYRVATCNAPPPPGNSGGQCASTVVDGKTVCNVVTQTGCPEGKVCKPDSSGKPVCIDARTDENEVCGACALSHDCPPGYGCLTGFCARYCCDDTDCAGTGVCKDSSLNKIPGMVGYCEDKYGGELGGMGGMGGMGGAGSIGGMGGIGGMDGGQAGGGG